MFCNLFFLSIVNFIIIFIIERVDKFIVKSNISLPINCKILKLFPEGVTTDQTTPRRTFPVLSQGISFYSSLHWPGQRSISYHL